MQGEGPYVGRPSGFVRLGGCDLRCAWCDSPETWRPATRCRVEAPPGSEVFRELDNPLKEAQLAEALEALGGHEGELVSITGGEPLLQPEAVAWIAQWLRDRDRVVFLETHGLAVEAMRRVARSIDVVSMDWKLGSDVRREGRSSSAPREDFHAIHEAFLAEAARAGEVYVKVVLTPATRDDELDEVCRRIAATAPATPLVLQPVTPAGSVDATPDAATLLRWVRRCGEVLADVRLIPQTHKAIGAL